MDETCVLKCCDVWEGQNAASFHLTSESQVIFKKRQLSNLLQAHSVVLRNPFKQLNAGTVLHNYIGEFNVTVGVVFHRHTHLHRICKRSSVRLCSNN